MRRRRRRRGRRRRRRRRRRDEVDHGSRCAAGRGHGKVGLGVSRRAGRRCNAVLNRHRHLPRDRVALRVVVGGGELIRRDAKPDGHAEAQLAEAEEALVHPLGRHVAVDQLLRPLIVVARVDVIHRDRGDRDLAAGRVKELHLRQLHLAYGRPAANAANGDLVDRAGRRRRRRRRWWKWRRRRRGRRRRRRRRQRRRRR